MVRSGQIWSFLVRNGVNRVVCNGPTGPTSMCAPGMQGAPRPVNPANQPDPQGARRFLLAHTTPARAMRKRYGMVQAIAHFVL